METLVFLILLGFGLTVAIRGGISMFAQDLSWAITEWQNSRRGVASERTEAWESNDRWTGVGAIVMGLGFIAAAVWYITVFNA